MMKRLIKAYWKDERASVALEAVIVIPILAWVFVASFVFFDAFRVYNTSMSVLAISLVRRDSTSATA